MREWAWFKRTVAYLLVALVPTLVLANKPYTASNSLEINNLKSEPVFHNANKTIGRDSRVIRYVYKEHFGPLTGSPRAMALTYLKANASKFGIQDPANDLQVKQVTTSPGGKHVTFIEVYNGIPVFQSALVVTLDNENYVSFVASNYRPALQVKTMTPSISSDAAIQTARNYLNVTGKLLAEQKASLMVFQSKDQGDLLTYRVQVPTDAPMGDWEVFVNATTGEIVHVKDQMMYDNGSGMVFNPDPLTTAQTTYGGAYQDFDDADTTSLNDQRVSVTLQDITNTSGTYSLAGPYVVLTDEETPTDNFPQLTDPNGFNYTRAQQEFEDVMVYFHVDSSYRRLMALGYDIPGLYSFAADPHGLDGQDNSHYNPDGNYCAWGEGGVDDAEDADVIWHEYEHAIQQQITGGMSYTGETQSLQEGASDYWAASYSRAVSEFAWGDVFTWDGHNPFWPGRSADLDWVYPDDYVSGHDGGQIFSSAMMHIWGDLGRDVTDQLFIEAHYLWGQSPGMQDAAQAVIQADINLYGGSHLSTIVNWFDYHGLVTADDYLPTIVHTPLTDTEDLTGPYTVTATIGSTQPLNPDSLLVFWSTDTTFNNVVVMTSLGNGDYSADIPGGFSSETNVQYYISATDSSGGTSTDPATAPTDFYEFHVGTDMEPPVITHNPLRDQAIVRWPATVSAGVTDNIGVASVELQYHINNNAIQSVAMTDDNGDGIYSAQFNESQSQVQAGDSVFYKIVATDASSQSNQASDPEVGNHSFEIIDALGVVLVIDDDVQGSQGNRIVTNKGVVYRSQDSWGRSASDFISYLETLGYVVDSTSTANYDAYDWNNYDVVVSSSGANTSPIDSVGYRNALVAFAQAGGKLLIEGGEVGYDAISYPGYPDVAANVLHATSWHSDNSGDIVLRSQYSNHPFVTTPNVLNQSFTITYNGYGDQDGVTADSEAIPLYHTSNDTSYTGMLLYDNNPNPTGGQIVYFPFNWASITDQVGRENLLDNALHYLTVQEAEPTGVISGVVDLTDTNDDSGVEVSVVGPGTSASTMTASDGSYTFTGLYNGTHVLTVSHDGYYPYVQTDTVEVIGGGSVTNANFSFDPIANGTISGNISVTGSDPVADSVIVQIGAQGIADTTGTDGNYTLSGIMPGPVTILAFKQGYISAQVDTFVDNGANLTIDMTLQLDLNPPLSLVAEDHQDTHVPLTWDAPRVAGPISEGFENINFPPAGWTQIITNATASDTPRTWGLFDIPDYVHTGQYSAGVWWDYDHQNEWLMTPNFMVGNGGQLEFWSFGYQGSTHGDHYYVKVSTDSGSTWSELMDLSAMPVYDNPDASNFNDYQEPYNLDLSAYAGQNVQIAWQAVDGDSLGLWYTWMIDDITVTSSAGVAHFSGRDLAAMNKSDAERDAQLKRLNLNRKLATTSPMRANPQFRYQPRKEAQIRFPKLTSAQIQSLSGFQIYRDTSPNIDVLSAIPLASTDASTRAYDDSSVVNGTTYYYVVTADYGADGQSPGSNEVHATPYNYPPSMPTGFMVSNTGTSVSMSWNANPEDDVIGYKIYQRVDANDWAVLDSTADLVYNITVEDNHVYQYRLSAYDDEGAESPLTETIVLQVGNIPPEQLTAQGGLDGHIFLEWDEPGTQFTIPDSIFFDFENGDADFVATGEFALGTPTSGPGNAYSGDNAWGTNLSGNYSDDTHSTLTSPEINLHGMSNPVLKYYQWFNTEAYFDGGNVKVSDDGGTTWTIVTPDSGYPEDAISTGNNFLGGEPAFSGHTIGEMWQPVRFDLSAYADETILVQFDFGSDVSINYPGWYIDNVTILDNTDYSHLLMAKSEVRTEKQLQLGNSLTEGTKLSPKTKTAATSLVKDPQKVKPHSMLRSIQTLMGYKIYRATTAIADTATATYVATVTDTTIFDDWGDGGNGLQNGTEYHYVVVADYGVDGRSSASNEATAIPVNEPPVAPDSLTASNTDLTVTLNWFASTSYDVAGYVIYVKTDDGDFAVLDSTSETTYTYDVENNHVYTYKVTAYDRDDAESDFSESVVIAIGNIPPESLAAEGGMDGHIFLEWDAPGTQFTVPDSFLYDFEADNGGFTGTGDFAWGTPSSGPGAAHSGTNLWGTNLSGNYPNNSSSTIVSPEIDLSRFTSPVLRFFQWYDIETNFDGGNVKVSTDGGSTWQLVTPGSGYPSDNIYSMSEPGFTGHDHASWERVEFNLSAYAGETIQLKFTFGSDGSVTYPGWYIDDVVVTDAVTFANVMAENYSAQSNKKRVNVTFKTTSGTPNQIGVRTLRTRNLEANELQRVDRKGRPISPFRSSLDLTGYNVYRSTSPNVQTITDNFVATVNDTTVYDDWGDGGNGLQNGTTYYYVVTAIYSNGESTPSNEASATPVNAPPLPPQNLTGGNSGVTVTLNWDASASYDVAGYYVYAALDGGDFARIDTTADATSTFDVEDNHFYEFKVSTYDNDGAESGFSNEVMLPIGNLPPEELAAQGGLDGHIMLEWNPPGSTYMTPDTLVYDFEEDNGGFTGAGGFEYGSPTNVGPATAYSGSNLWGVALAAAYSNDTYATLVSPEIDLSDYDAPYLGFFQWYDIETGWDGGNVKVSTDGGSTWELITPVSGYPDDNITALDEPGFTGHDNADWELVQFDLSAYADQTVQFKFTFGSDGSVTYPGWYIDNVMVYSNAQLYVHGMPFSQYKRQVAERSLHQMNTKSQPSLNKHLGNRLSQNSQSAPVDPFYRDIQTLAGYKIYRATTPNVDVSDQTLIATIGDTTMYDDWGDGSGLTNGTTYYYVVVADYGADGTSSASNEASAAPVNAPPAAPTGLQAHVDGMTVDLSWSSSTAYDMNHYVVYRASGTSNDFSQIGTSEDTTYTDNLSSDGAYRYGVMVVDNDGAPSDMSSPSSFMMVGHIPPMISAESGHQNMVPLEVQPWVPGEEMVLAYDDSSAEASLGNGDTPLSMAVRMDPPGSGEVKNLQYFWANQDGAQQAVVPTVWSDNGGVPGDIIYEGPEYTPDLSNYWQTIPVTNVTFDTTFWVGFQYQTGNGPGIGLDNNGTRYLHSYIYNPSDQSWIEIGTLGGGTYAGNFLIRSTVLVIPQNKDALSQPILAYHPVYREIGATKQQTPLLRNSNSTVNREIDWNATQSYEVDPPYQFLTDYAKVADAMDITDFQIFRRSENQSDFSMIASIPATQNLYNDENLGGQTTYYYYAKAVYAPGNAEDISPPSDTVSAVPSGEPDATQDMVKLPTTFAMEQNYPNPFNPTTSIKYQLPKAEHVRIVIFNMLGQQIRTLVNTNKQAGYYNEVWDGMNNNGLQVSSGVYFYSIQAGKFQKTRKMILLR